MNFHLQRVRKQIVWVKPGASLRSTNDMNRLLGHISLDLILTRLWGKARYAVKFGLSRTKIFEMIHAHPTLPESFAEALRDIENKCIHTPVKNPNKNCKKT